MCVLTVCVCGERDRERESGTKRNSGTERENQTVEQRETDSGTEKQWNRERERIYYLNLLPLCKFRINNLKQHDKTTFWGIYNVNLHQNVRYDLK